MARPKIIIFLEIFHFWKFFRLQNRLPDLPDGSPDSLDQYNIQEKNQKQFFFGISLYFSLFRYKRSFNTINRCWDPSRIVENDLGFNPVLIWCPYEL